MVYVGAVVLVVGLTVPMDEPVPAMKLEYQGGVTAGQVVDDRADGDLVGHGRS